MTHRPLVAITTSFAIGIFTNYLFGIPSFHVFPAIFLTIIVYTFLFIFHFRGGILTLLILIFLTGISYHHLRFSSNAGNNISNFINAEKIPVRLRGVVVSQPIDEFVPDPPLSSIEQHKKMSTFLFRGENREKNQALLQTPPP